MPLRGGRNDRPGFAEAWLRQGERGNPFVARKSQKYMDEKIRLITQPIARAELKAIAEERFGDMIKAVVDVEKKMMAVGAEMHADEESFLLEQGSSQTNLWGINLYPDAAGDSFLEFDSMINIRPRQNNRSRSVESQETREQILTVVKNLVLDL